MPIGLIIVVFVVMGVIMYLINRFVPMEAGYKTALNIIILVLLCLWVLNMFIPIMSYTLPTKGYR